jgi:dephospho-CoA kinase
VGRRRRFLQVKVGSENKERNWLINKIKPILRNGIRN